MRSVLKVFTAGLVLFVLPVARLGAEHPTKERGFRPDGLYQFTELDSVNLFNGSINIMLPIGQSYPVSSNLNYSFALRYAGNLWTEQERGGGPLAEDKIYFVPRKDNAGFGWNLSFGELEEGAIVTATGGQTLWKYHSPDGGEHVFFATLRPGETPVPGVEYTRDSTYIRMKEVNANRRLLEFPNGRRLVFEKLIHPTRLKEWQLRYIFDSFNTTTTIPEPGSTIPRPWPWIEIVHTDDATGEWVERWTVTDSVGRTHRVFFRPPAGGINNQPVVDRIELQAFDGLTATYDLGYNEYTNEAGGSINDGGVSTIRRPCRYTLDRATVSAHMLRIVRLSKGDPNSAIEPYTSFRMEYEAGPQTCDGSPAATNGLLKSMILPTGGRYEWDYRIYNFSGEMPYESAVGVSERRVFEKVFDEEDDTYTLVQVRTYQGTEDQTVVRTLKPAQSPSTAHTTDLKQVHYFTEDGRPFQQGSGPGPFLSTETYDCDEESSTETCGSVDRRVYLKYEEDVPQPNCQAYPCTTNRNRRVAVDKTVYESDGARFAQTVRSEFDELGHYRKTTLTGTFGSGNTREEVTNYNPLAGTPPGPTLPQNWLLETFDKKSVVEGSYAETAKFAFDATTGRLDTVRKRAGTYDCSHDLVTRYTYDDHGNVTHERFFGGDVPDATPTCIDNATGSEDYAVEHTYSDGVRKSSRYLPRGNESLPFTADYDIDPSTGFIKTARDSTGLATQFEFDALGRLRWELPALGHDAYTQYQYVPATSGTPAQAIVRRRINGNRDGSILTESRYTYDSLGRPFMEQQRLPGGTFNRRETAFDWAGRKAYVTETVQDAGVTPTPRTSYRYDGFGRPLTITPPDGPAHAETYSYAGVREKTRTRSIATTETGETAVESREEYDRQGRLWKVRENAGGGEIVTQYGYDGAGRLRSVAMTGPDGYTQPERVFSYDGRGLLTTESHPESGVTNYLYDALGQVLRKDTPALDLQYQYDGAARLQQVQQTGLGALKAWTFSQANSGQDRSNGKVATATRYNYLPALGGTTRVQETYTYAGRGGRVSSTKTEIFEGTSQVASQTFTTSQAFDELGARTDTGYPACTGCTGAVAPNRTVLNEFTGGFLTSIDGYANGIAYHPNGLLKSITHETRTGNDVLTVSQTIAPNGMARPETISVDRACTVAFLSHPQSTTIESGGYAILSATATNGATITWYKGNGQPLGSYGNQTSVFPTQTTEYYAEADNFFCTATSNRATVTVTPAQPPPATPTNFSAVAVGTTAVELSWSSSGTVDRYEIDRKSAGTGWVELVTAQPITGTAFTDTGLSANNAYLYRVRAIRGSVESSPSDIDVATTVIFTDPSLVVGGVPVAGVTAKVLHITQLRTAVNAVRALSGLGGGTYSDPALTNNTLIRAAHILDLRAALSDARSALGLTTMVYQYPSVTGTIRAMNIKQLRDGVEAK